MSDPKRDPNNKTSHPDYEKHRQQGRLGLMKDKNVDWITLKTVARRQRKRIFAIIKHEICIRQTSWSCRDWKACEWTRGALMDRKCRNGWRDEGGRNSGKKQSVKLKKERFQMIARDEQASRPANRPGHENHLSVCEWPTKVGTQGRYDLQSKLRIIRPSINCERVCVPIGRSTSRKKRKLTASKSSNGSTKSIIKQEEDWRKSGRQSEADRQTRWECVCALSMMDLSCRRRKSKALSCGDQPFAAVFSTIVAEHAGIGLQPKNSRQEQQFAKRSEISRNDKRMNTIGADWAQRPNHRPSEASRRKKTTSPITKISHPAWRASTKSGWETQVPNQRVCVLSSTLLLLVCHER